MSFLFVVGADLELPVRSSIFHGDPGRKCCGGIEVVLDVAHDLG